MKKLTRVSPLQRCAQQTNAAGRLRLMSWMLCGALGGGLLAPSVALAQRRVVGGDDDEEEAEVKQDEAAKKRREKKKKENAEKEKKAKADAEKKRVEREAKAAAAEAAAEAAEKAAEEAEAKAEEDKRKAEEEKVAKEQRRLESNKAARLKEAKRMRQYMRKDGKLRFHVKMTSGAPVANKMVEVRFKADRLLAVASARYGKEAPEKHLHLVATITEPAARGKPVVHHLQVHAMEGAGQYGFHFTPTKDGPHEISIAGNSKKGEVSIGLTLLVGEWPPSDFEDEERNNESVLAQSTGTGEGE